MILLRKVILSCMLTVASASVAGAAGPAEVGEGHVAAVVTEDVVSDHGPGVLGRVSAELLPAFDMANLDLLLDEGWLMCAACLIAAVGLAFCCLWEFSAWCAANAGACSAALATCITCG